MGWPVIFSTRSKQDLQRIVEYIARDGLAAAERFGLALIDQAVTKECLGSALGA